MTSTNRTTFEAASFLSYAYLRLALRLILSILLVFTHFSAIAQTLGGESVFNFLKLPNTPQLTALGGVNISESSNDAGLAFNNPSQLVPAMHTQMNAVFNSHYSGISVYHLSLAYRQEKIKTNFLFGLNYFNYGSSTATDPAGNILGSFRPTDWVMQLSASRAYGSRWNYGMSIKFIQSSYGQFRSNGIAADVGLRYTDSSGLFSASVLAKNMGTQLKAYPGARAEDLPFDLQIGFTKRMAAAPFGISLTGQRVHRFNIRYEDTVFNQENGFPNSSEKKFTAGKLLDHLVLGASIYFGDRVEFQAGYNFLRRRELNIGNEGNGFNGFSLGAAVHLGKLDIRYARAFYQGNTAYNQFGLNMTLNRYFGLGKWGEKIGW